MRFDRASRDRIAALKPILEDAIPRALDRFYEMARATPETRSFFRDEAHLAHARAQQSRHWKIIATDDFGDAYVESVMRIGRVHSRIGLEPRWHIGAYGIVAAELINSIIEARLRKSRIRPQERHELSLELAALMKAVLLDVDFAITSYKEDLDSEVIDRLGAALKRLAGGDLTTRVSGLSSRFVSLADDFNTSIARLENLIGSVSDGAQQIQTITAEVAAAAEDLSRRTEVQATSLERTAQSVAEVAETVQSTARDATSTAAIVTETQSGAQAGGEIVKRAIEAMAAIERSAARITDITSLVEQISFQTNLLALNASVEAARAGDAGRGFAVVANEVRMLAHRSADATKEIKQLIAESAEHVASGVSEVRRTGDALEEIIGRINKISDLVAEIATRAAQQAAAMSQVSESVAEMDRGTQQNSAVVQQSSAAARQLAEEAESLACEAGRFVTRNDDRQQTREPKRYMLAA